MERSITPRQTYLFLGLLVIIALEYLRLGQYIPLINTFKGYTVIPLSIFILCFLSSSGIKSMHIVLKSLNSKLLLVFLGLLLSSLIIYGKSPRLESFLSGAIGYYFLFFIISKCIYTERRLKAFILTLIICHLLLILQNIEIISNPSTRSYIKNGASFLGDGNDFALSLCILVPFNIYLFHIEENKKLRVTYLILFVVSIAAVIGTQSRGASLALICLIGYFLIKSKNKFRFFISLSILMIPIALYAPSAYFNRLQHVNNIHEASAQSRILAWKAGIAMANDFPFYGVGVGNFPYRYAEDYWNYENLDPYPKNAHSLYFTALGELGYPGLIFLLYFLYINIRKNNYLSRKLIKNIDDKDSKKHINLIKYSSGAIVAFAVAGAFLSVLYYPHIFILAGFQEGIRNIIKQSESPPAEREALGSPLEGGLGSEKPL